MFLTGQIFLILYVIDYVNSIDSKLFNRTSFKINDFDDELKKDKKRKEVVSCDPSSQSSKMPSRTSNKQTLEPNLKLEF